MYMINKLKDLGPIDIGVLILLIAAAVLQIYILYFIFKKGYNFMYGVPVIGILGYATYQIHNSLF